MSAKRLLAFALIVLGAAALALLADAIGGLTGVDQFEARTVEWRQTTTAESFQVGIGERESDIVLVLFDSLSVQDWPWLSPFPRTVLAELVDAVAGAGARAIGLDVYLESAGKTPAQLRADTLLRDAMARAGNVVLVGPVIEAEDGPVVGQPHPFFAGAAVDVGTAELPPAFEGTLYGTLAVRTSQGLEPSFATALWGLARGVDVDSLLHRARAEGRIDLPGLPASEGRVPLDWWEEGASPSEVIVPFPVRYVGPPSSSDATAPPGTFQAFSSFTTPVTAMLSPDFFEGKIVLMGSGFHASDRFRTPFFGVTSPADTAAGRPQGRYRWTYGVEIHANALQNMLDEEYVRPASRGLVVLLLLVLAALAGFAAFRWGATLGGVAAVAVVLGWGAVAWWLWAGQIYLPGGISVPLGARFLLVPVVTPSLSAILGYVGSVAYVSVVEGREKRYIKGAMGKYVPPDVVAEIAANPEALQLGGQKRTLTLLFSDLEGFTSLSEKVDPQDLLARLNEYLTDMTQIVMDERGTLDKYIGDAVMAFWNAPKELADHADRGMRTAIRMQRRMRALNERWRARDPEARELRARIGVNTGVAVVGNVGGEDRFDYSAIGDTVNLAARLEPANKTYGTLVMVSEHTLAGTADPTAYRYRDLDVIAVSGKKKPVRVYELLEMAGVTLEPHREEAIALYEEGMAAYRDHAWARALTLFEAALEADPDDGPAKVYAERAAANAAEPPPPDWDFVVHRTEK